MEPEARLDVLCHECGGRTYRKVVTAHESGVGLVRATVYSCPRCGQIDVWPWEFGVDSRILPAPGEPNWIWGDGERYVVGEQDGEAQE